MSIVDELVLDSKTPTVFVVQEDRGKNLLPALEFGTLEALLGPDDQILLNSRATVTRMWQKLRTYTGQDYVLAIGDPVAIGIACTLAAKANGGKFSLLKWDRMERRYYVVYVDTNDD